MYKRWTGDIKSNKNIYIYGAGSYGLQLFRLLGLLGAGKRIVSFLVTSTQNNKDEIYGVPVTEIESVNSNINESIVIVAIKDSEEICKKLQEIYLSEIYYIDHDFYVTIPDLIYETCCKVPLVKNKVFFSCFMGSGYTCNCKYIAEKILESNKNIDMVWELECYGTHSLPEKIRAVVKGTPEYYSEWYSSKIIVSNSGISSSMKSREGQFIIDTWHGIGPTKKIGIDVNCDKERRETIEQFRERYKLVNLMTAASDLCIRNYREAFLYSGEIIKSGYPRNDIFFSEDYEKRRTIIRARVGIQSEELMVLYAPTFRYEQRNVLKLRSLKQQYDFSWSAVKESLGKRFHKEPRLVYRFHHVTNRALNIHGKYSDGFDATDYPDMQELLLAADVLITDYSSSMWDFSLTRKPVFLFYNDADEVDKEVGFYRHPDEYPYPKGHTIKELCEAIEGFDDKIYQKALDVWFDEYGTYDDGHASERVVNRIMEVINQI